MKVQAFKGNSSAPADATVILDGDRGDVVDGGNGRGGDVKVLDDGGVTRIHLDAGGAETTEAQPPATQSILLSGATGTIEAGGHGQAGKLLLKGAGLVPNTTPEIRLQAVAENNEGNISVRDIQGRKVFKFDAEHARLRIGESGNEGDIIVQDNAGREVVKLGGEHAALFLGAQGNEGDIIIRDKDGRDSIELDGAHAALYLGAFDNPGNIIVRKEALVDAIKLNGEKATLHVGGAFLPGRITVANEEEKVTIDLDGEKGDIILKNADCAEDFDVSGVAHETGIEPGTVVGLDEEGAIEPCTKGYDGRVAGVVSGAGDYRPALGLDRHPGKIPRLPVALLGKVFCKVDAQYGAVRPGDLLTTSPTVGHAMKASDRDRAFGAVLGKALRSLDQGCALIPILVTLK
jgi:hypothetical protein